MGELVVDRLNIDFGGIKALDNVSLTVKEGEVVGLIGPNGAGKTTVINCISRIYNPTSGKIAFNGEDLLDVKPHRIVDRKIARTFQDLNFFSTLHPLSVLDYMKLGDFSSSKKDSFVLNSLRLPSSVKKDVFQKKKLREVLGVFRKIREQMEPPQKERGYPILYGKGGYPDLLDVESNPIRDLSFAWRKRLDLARALASEPKLLLLDEPAQGLAPSEIDNLGRFLKILSQDSGISIVIVEHNISMVLNISDRVVVMSNGRVIAEGSPQETSDNPEVQKAYFGESKLKKSPKQEARQGPQRKKTDVLLDVSELDLFYGKAQALNRVSMQVMKNQVVSILGTNGSGKSTLLKAISGVEKPALGTIHLDGMYIPLGFPELAVETGIQYVPQGHQIFEDLSVLENLRLGSYMYKMSGNRFQSELTRVLEYFPDLKDMLREKSSNLSGGQQQMLVLAQALMARPKLLMADEPSLGLAPRLVDRIFEIIAQISVHESCSVVIVEQNVAKALEVSDYVYMLSSGMMVGKGTAQSFIENEQVVKKNLGFY